MDKVRDCGNAGNGRNVRYKQLRDRRGMHWYLIHKQHLIQVAKILGRWRTIQNVIRHSTLMNSLTNEDWKSS